MNPRTTFRMKLRIHRKLSKLLDKVLEGLRIRQPEFSQAKTAKPTPLGRPTQLKDRRGNLK